LRDPGRELDVLQPARNLAGGIAEHLAMLEGHERREFVAVRVEEFPEREEHRCAARQGRMPPLACSLRRRGHRSGELGGRGQIDLGGLQAGRRVVDRAGAARLSGGQGAVDPMRYALNHGSHTR
jgi:hypothetical protein